MSQVLYPTVQEITQANKRVLEIVVDKRDRHLVWNEEAIAAAVALPSAPRATSMTKLQCS